MKINIVGKNVEVTPSLKDSIDKKISKLQRYFEKDIEARATLSIQKSRQIFEVTIPFNGVILRCEESTEDMYKSIDLVQDKLERQIRKQRTKLARRNSDSLKFENIYDLSQDEVACDSEVVKVKKFEVKPMNLEEAVLQMDLVEHNFFVYRDSDSSNVNVLYKRKDGKIGLLEPDYI